MELKDTNGKVIAKVTGCDCNAGDVDEGVWVEVLADDGTRPTLCLVKTKTKGEWYLGVYRDAKAPSIKACDLAVSFGGVGPTLQVTKGDKVAIVDLFDLVTHVQNHQG